MIKLAAFDVDGTLRDREYIPESARRAVARLKARGVIPVLCTGRSEYEIRPLREELGIDWAVTCNGSHIGFCGRTVSGNAFAEETIREWRQTAERRGHTLLLYGSENMYTTRQADPYFQQAQREIGFMEPLPLNPEEEAPAIYQCIIFCGEEEEREYTGKNRQKLYIHRWRKWAVDINPNGRNKAGGLRELLDRLAIRPEEAAAFGDGLNDLELIESVGTGIAMGNAVDVLKEKARYVTRSLRDDGIGYAVDRWILPESC